MPNCDCPAAKAGPESGFCALAFRAGTEKISVARLARTLRLYGGVRAACLGAGPLKFMQR